MTISSYFWMGDTEVTEQQWVNVMGGASPGGLADFPKVLVSWHDARAYCAALTAQQSLFGALPPGYEYRLPTEAEWEYACRAGTTTEFNVGSALFCNQANFSYSYHSNSYCPPNFAIAVSSYPANVWGLPDMHGNVLEWCLDSSSLYSIGAVADPFVTGGPTRVIRGGSWNHFSNGCRSASRGDFFPVGTHSYVGFRVVLAPVLVP